MPIQMISDIADEQQVGERFLATVSSRSERNALRSALRRVFREYSAVFRGASLLQHTRDTFWIHPWLDAYPSMGETTRTSRLDAVRRIMRFQYAERIADHNIYEFLRQPYSKAGLQIAFPRTGFSMQREAELWISDLQRMKPTTKELHRRRALKFAVFSARSAGPWPSQEMIEEWVKALQERSKAAEVRAHVHSLTLFLRHLERRGLIHDNPMERLMRECPARGLQRIVHALGTASPDRALHELRRRRGFRSSLADEFRGYLELKRATGRVYAYEESMLLSLDRFLQDGTDGLDAETFDAWIKSLAHLHSSTQSHYYHQGRQFCEYLRRSRPEAFVPAAEFHPLPTLARTPNVLDREDVVRLFAAAAALAESRRAPLRRRSFQTMLTLLYCCGLRLGETLRLNIGDVNVSQGVLTVRNTKFFKSRLVPMDATVTSRVADYLKIRRNVGYTGSVDAPLFCSSRNRRYFKTTVRHGLYRLMESVGIRTPWRRVRIHDLRHTFAVHRLSQWYRDGEDVQAKLPILSQYLGHVDITYTQKYLKLVPELCKAAMDRFQQYAVPLRRFHDEER